MIFTSTTEAILMGEHCNTDCNAC